jgi:hypothetical protein
MPYWGCDGNGFELPGRRSMVTKKEMRDKRLAAALRANLKRRKEAAKASESLETPEPDATVGHDGMAKDD